VLLTLAPTGLAQKVTLVLVVKRQHKLELMDGRKVIRSYSVALGRGGLAPKQRQGDHRTPEGFYKIDGRNKASRFYRALHISYPNQDDRERARKLGVNPGGDVEIHGLPNGRGWLGSLLIRFDWTDGCIAVTDADMDQIWALVPDGTPVEIEPTLPLLYSAVGRK
jgi:murein L,D-transpeptidase YafK